MKAADTHRKRKRNGIPSRYKIICVHSQACQASPGVGYYREKFYIFCSSEGIQVIYGDVCNRKIKRRKRQKFLATEQLEDFAKNTTLHGLRYVTERKLSVVERTFWVLTFLLSVAMCSYLILNVWTKWSTSPVLVTISEQLVPVEMVPFPSVTICPQMKTKSTVYNYTAEMKRYESISNDTLGNVTESNVTSKEKFEDITLLCGYYSLYYPERNYSDSIVAKHILEVSPTHDDVFFACNWRDTNLGCKDLFQSVLTQEGVCFIMNTLPVEEHLYTDNIHGDYEYLSSSKQRSKGWSLSRGYEKNVKDPYPRRGRPNAGVPDLRVILNEESKERDINCNTLNSGYKVYIQHPSDYPQSSLYYYSATPGHVASAAVSFSIMSTANNLRDYSPEVRQCYFPNERYLRYFRIYTANNCKLECITNFTFEYCGCIGFHMPHENSSRICIQEHINCIMKAEGILAEENFDSDLKTRACNCLPACDSVDFDAEIFKTELRIHDLFKNIWQYDPNDTSFSQLEVYFKKPRFVSMRRSELFGTTDFLANCGGLLGLFLGFSFLSLVEIFYYVTLRLWCTLKRDAEEQKRAMKQNE